MFFVFQDLNTEMIQPTDGCSNAFSIITLSPYGNAHSHVVCLCTDEKSCTLCSTSKHLDCQTVVKSAIGFS